MPKIVGGSRSCLRRIVRKHGPTRWCDTMQKWYERLERKVEKMIKSAEGSAGLLHKITKPTMWRRRVQILRKEEEEDARLLDRCEAKRKEWAKFWQCDEEIQNMQNKPWRSEELKECEEALPRLKEGDLDKASRLYKAKTGVGCDGLHPKVPLDVTKETRGETVEFLERVEQSGKWPQRASTTMFFLIPENVTSERPIALMLTLIRWWEAMRAPGVAKWQQKYRVEWDARDGRNGEQRIEGLWGAWATHLCFPKKILRVLCGKFEHQWRVQFDGCAAEPLTTITAILEAKSQKSTRL